jgi:hypothetical protein
MAASNLPYVAVRVEKNEAVIQLVFPTVAEKALGICTPIPMSRGLPSHLARK